MSTNSRYKPHISSTSFAFELVRKGYTFVYNDVVRITVTQLSKASIFSSYYLPIFFKSQKSARSHILRTFPRPRACGRLVRRGDHGICHTGKCAANGRTVGEVQGAA
ncbi:hypothetical protein BC937DRAFT_93139 [Endogone sp. FLAS-F59071]|nr:hypothetical protein BC937DRAFT_93139 [Endogone sp. FLAS-F59071]|eukprot:RUS14940.1 hypothetical protein BC937DRAFT_93139 [Endogone sp. FLAS-F59071]